MNRFVELSHPIEDGMVTCPGFPPPAITDHVGREASRARYAPGTEFHFGRINMVANTGTYLDAPSHRFAAGIDIADLPLERLAALRGVVVDRPGTQRAIPAVTLDGVDVTGRAVLFRTGWDRHWRTAAYGVDHPYWPTRARPRWSSEAPRSSASTPSTSMTPPPASGRSTRRSWGPAS